MNDFVNGFRTHHVFERTELRVLQSQLDNETFLNVVAELWGKSVHTADSECLRANKAEGELLELRNE